MKSILNLLSIREYIMGGISLLFAGVVHGQNPIVQTCYTTDPAPMVHDGTLYVYTGHDEDKADFFWMQEWRVYSTKDMVNWTDHGSPLAIESFDWADDRAWAAQCIEHNGKFYWYVCLRSKLTNTMAIGVAVGDSPLGPLKMLSVSRFMMAVGILLILLFLLMMTGKPICIGEIRIFIT